MKQRKSMVLMIALGVLLSVALMYCIPSEANDMRGWMLEDQIKQARLAQGPHYVGHYRYYRATCKGNAKNQICTYRPRQDLQHCEGYLNCRDAAQHGENER